MKKLFSVILCFAFIFTFAACGNDESAVSSTSAETIISTEAGDTEAEETEESSESSVSETEATTEITAEEITTAASATEKTTEKTTETTTKASTTKKVTTTKATTAKKETTTKKVTTTKATTTTKKAVTAPTSKADILAIYNKAANNVSTSKPSYTKTNKTTITSLEMGALGKMSVVRDAVGGFLGEGTNTTDVKKGTFNGTDLKKSSLKAEDITSATCKLSSDKKKYIITLTVKNESDLSKKTSALGRFTNDYKDVAEIKAGLEEAGASAEGVTLTTTSVVIKAEINVDNYRFTSLSHSVKMKAVLTNVRYSIAKVSEATGTLDISVNYSSFKY